MPGFVFLSARRGGQAQAVGRVHSHGVAAVWLDVEHQPVAGGTGRVVAVAAVFVGRFEGRRLATRNAG